MLRDKWCGRLTGSVLGPPLLAGSCCWLPAKAAPRAAPKAAAKAAVACAACAALSRHGRNPQPWPSARVPASAIARSKPGCLLCASAAPPDADAAAEVPPIDVSYNTGKSLFTPRLLLRANASQLDFSQASLRLAVSRAAP